MEDQEFFDLMKYAIFALESPSSKAKAQPFELQCKKLRLDPHTTLEVAKMTTSWSREVLLRMREATEA